jgi:hypothetical protein
MKIILGIILICSLMACGSGSNSNSNPLSGTWQFTGHSEASGSTFTGTAAIQQNGNSLGGTITLDGSPCGTSATISGSVSGTAVTIDEDLNGQQVNLSGMLNAQNTSMSGNYTAPSGGCTNGDYGTWSATKS